MSDRPSVHDQARAQFGKTADAYVNSLGHAKGEDLDLMLALAGDVRELDLLDVATGGGHTALAFARAGARVVASDLTPEMLQAAERFIRSQLPDAHAAFQLAAAESLPFEDDRFDIVTCRIAPHHFQDPAAFVREAARVLKPGGRFLLIDNVAPEDPELAQAMNHIEKARDPSHVEAYTVHRWIQWLSHARLDPHHLARWRRSKDLRAWAAMAQLPDDQIDALQAHILQLPERTRRYLDVQHNASGGLSLCHEAALFMAVKML